MRHTTCSFILAAVLSQSVMAEPQQAPQATPNNVPVIRSGVVDLQRVILTVKDGKTTREQLQKEIQDKEKEFSTKKAELDKLNKEFNDQVSLLSEDAKRRKQQEFQKKYMDFQSAESEFQQLMKQKEMKATQKITEKVSGIVTEMAKTDHFYQVVERQSSGFLYLQDAIDLTDDVISRYDGIPGSHSSKANIAKNTNKNAGEKAVR